MRLFGFEIKRPDDDVKNQPVSFAEPLNDDGALTVGGAVGGSYGMLLDLEGTAKSEAELVTRYRALTINPEIQQAIDEIVNESISVDSHDKVVNIILDETNLPDKVKEKISEEFQNILQLLDFSNSAYEIFTKFYVDGRLNYHVIIDEKNLKEGIKELRYLDPRKIRLIREMQNEQIKDQASNALVKKIKKEYYMYSESGFGASKVSNYSSSIQGLKIAKDAIVRVTSGLLNENNSVVLSHLHKSIKSLNQLRILEDATIIYTMTRAPERRIFYVDVGNLPKAKAEQYLHDMMARHKNRVTYDPSSGEIKDDRKMMTMTEDYWFPRREGNNATEVTTLNGGSGLGEDKNLPYFQSKLYKSLNVPVARLQPETMYSFGRMSDFQFYLIDALNDNWF
jgi:polyhydroxyalkanoate synthesis regulator phasin